MKDDEINLLAEINSFSKIHTLKRDDIDSIMLEIAQRVVYNFRIERMSAWLFSPTKDSLISMGEYDIRDRKFTKDSVLLKRDYPNYFKAIEENEIILAPNIHTNLATYELSDDYSKPNDVISLMDIPLRIEGELVGVMCFEKTGKIQREFSKNEQVFALSLSIVFSSTLEARKRRAIQHKLNLELKEKDTLLKEIHHRVKNNLAVVSSLINLQSNKAKDAFHKALFDECRNKINTISGIHDIVYKSKSFSEIDVKEYFSILLFNLKEFFSSNEKNIELEFDIDKVILPIELALPLALLINEVVTNSYKHAFPLKTSGKIFVSIKLNDNLVQLIILDNGNGFNPNIIHSDSLGMEIIKGLVEQLNGDYSFINNDGTTFNLSFSLNLK